MAKIGLVAGSKQEAAPANPEPVEADVAQRGAAPQEHDELDRLRGILFGSLRKDQEKALARLEHRIAAQATALRGELDELVRRLENRIEELEARSGKDHDDLREQLVSQSNLLNESLEERSAQVTELVNERLRELSDAKLDRVRFATFVRGLREHLDTAHAESGGARHEATQRGTHPERPETRRAPAAKAGSAADRKPWHPARSL